MDDELAQKYVNDPTIEAAFAFHAFEHGQMHMNLLCSVCPQDLKLTCYDETIYATFRDMFPELKVDVIHEEDLKSAIWKERWRAFISRFAEMEDHNFGTLLRLNCKGTYDAENTTLVTRIQWFAVEIARNKEGLNDCVRSIFPPDRLYSEDNL